MKINNGNLNIADIALLVDIIIDVSNRTNNISAVIAYGELINKVKCITPTPLNQITDNDKMILEALQ